MLACLATCTPVYADSGTPVCMPHFLKVFRFVNFQS